MKRLAAVLITALFTDTSVAAALGSVHSGEELNDSATVCFSVGFQASLTGLDDFRLAHNQALVDGQPGAKYTGNDDFHLESNGQVQINISGGVLTNGSSVISPRFTFESGDKILLTEPNATHSGGHSINGEYQIRGISEQKAGEYSGTITLTVTPAIGGLSGCGGSVHTFPENEAWGTIMWEDLYPHVGDGDYNDFIVHFRIEETYDASQNLESIVMDFMPAARGAGYNHSLGLSLDGIIEGSKNITTETTPVFLGEADVKVSYTNLNNMQTHERHFTADDNITIFNSTRVAMGDGYSNVYAWEDYEDPHWVTRVEINVDSNSITDLNGLASGMFNYRPYLHVNNTNKDIDIYNVNSADGMISSNGDPFGIMIPDAIYWPAERVSLSSVYPYYNEFKNWLDGNSTTLSAQASEWYNYPSPDAGSNLLYYQMTP